MILAKIIFWVAERAGLSDEDVICELPPWSDQCLSCLNYRGKARLGCDLCQQLAFRMQSSAYSLQGLPLQTRCCLQNLPSRGFLGMPGLDAEPLPGGEVVQPQAGENAPRDLQKPIYPLQGWVFVHRPPFSARISEGVWYSLPNGSEDPHPDCHRSPKPCRPACSSC